MECRKTIIFLMIAIFLFSIASVSASDVNDTVIAFEDTSQNELSDCNEIVSDNLKASEENNILEQTDTDNAVSAESDSEILGESVGNYTDLRNDIANGGSLTKSIYYYHDGDGETIGITTNFMVIDGNGAVIDMSGSNKRAFYVSASHVTIKNLTIKNANYNGDGGAIYFGAYGTVLNCNFADNSASRGGAVYFSNPGTVSNCKFTNNKVFGNPNWGGAICMGEGRVENCYFADNSASQGGAILSVQYLGVTVDTCIFKTGSDTAYNTRNLPPVLNVDNFTTVYGSGEKITFDLKTNSGVPVSDGNISISVYFKDTNEWVGNYSCLSGEGWIPNLPAGSYYVIYDTEYAEFNAINRTITITLPAGKYYVNVTSLITGNKTVNVTAKTDVPKDMIWGAKLVFILPNGFEINASYGGNGTWWAVHRFDDCSVYQISASYVGVDNVTVNNGTIEVNPPEHTFWFLNYTINGNDNSVIELSNDFYFDPDYDAAFVDGIVINRPVTINGNGHTIDAKGQARIFYVQSENTVIKNLTIQNVKRNDVGGAIYFSSYGTVTNCNFTNNFAHDGGAVYFKGSGTVSNCKFSDNHASTWGGAICMYSGRVENCYFADNSASKGGAILGVQYLTVTVDTCIFKTGSDTAYNTRNLPPVLNVDNFTTVYGSGEKITFDLKTNSGVPVSGGNISISVYFKDNNDWVGNYSCLSGEGWIPNLPVGSYYVIYDTEYAEFNAINRTITITMPAGKYYVNVTSLTTGNKTVNITAKTDVPKDLIWGDKLLFILPNGSEINASYGGNGTWWAVHTFDDYDVYQISASYVGLDNVTVNNGTIAVPVPGHTFWFLNYLINGNGNSMIELSDDFYFDPDYDAAFVDGIVINRQVTINGNGHTIDAKGQARIFYVQSENTVIENLTIQNAKRKDAGGAIYFGGYGTVTNCNFTNNSAIQGGVVYFCNQGTVSNCKFSDNKAIGYDGWGGAICMNSGRVENCYFVNNSASKGGAILGIQYLTVTVDTCIFKTGSDTTFNTRNLPPVLNVDNFATVYGSGEKIIFDLKTNSSVPVGDGNISISVYFKDTNVWVGNYSCLSGEGWIPDLPVGSYYVIYDTEYAEFQLINRTITITLPAGKYYVNVTSLTTGNNTVNITAKTNVLKDMIWDAKLVFILPDGSEINASYGGNGTWWAVHTFDDYGFYQISASYVGVDNVTVNSGTIAVFASEHTFSFLNYIINGNGNSVIELSDDFYFDPEYDSAFVEGIVINRPVTIKGNGHTIDAKGQARIFYVQSENTVIENLTLQNANYNGDGGAIYFSSYGTVLNCNFTDNKATIGYSRGGAVYFVNRGTVSNCKFIGNNAFYWGGAICMGSGRVENCYFADNSASQGGAILSVGYLGVTVDTCIFKTGSDTTFNTRNLPPVFNVDNFTTVYGSGEKIAFDLKTNSGVPVGDGNISISVYFKDDNSWVGNYSCLSGQGWIPDLMVGSYYVIFDTEYAEFQPINRTITVTVPAGNYYIKVNSLTTGNKTVNITATNILKDMIGEVKLLFILPDGSEINASYGGNGTWWAVHTFDEYGVYQISASCLGLDNVTVRNGTITINKADSTITLENITLNYGNLTNLTVTTAGATGITAKIDGNDIDVINNFIIQIPVLNAGNHTLTVTTVPDDDHNPATKTVNITVNKVDSILTVSGIAFDYGGSGSIVVSFTGADGVNAKVVGQGDEVVKVNGTNIIVSGLNSGFYTLTVTTIADMNHNNVTKNVTVTVNKVDATLTVDDVVLDYGETKNITVMAEGVVGIVAVIGESEVKVDGFVISIPVLDAGTYTLSVTAIADANHNNVTKNVTVTVNKVDASLTVDDVVLDYGETKDVAVMGEGVVGIVAVIGESEVKVDGFVISVPVLDVGTYTLTVTTIADANHNNVTKNVTVTVNKVDATLTVDDVALDYGETKNITVMGEGVVGIVAVIGESEVKVDGFVISVPVLDAGTHTLTVTAIADANHNPVTKEVSIRVLKVDSTLAFEKINFDESSIVIAANGASGVTAKIDGVDIVVVDNYTIVIPSLAAGDHILSVTTIPDVSHNPVTSNVTIVVNKLQTELSGNDVIATYNVNTDLVITLKDSAGKALSGVKVTVDLNGAKTYTTDKNGQVKIPTKGLAPKSYTAKITFNGDANHDKSAKNIKVTVKKATPKMTAKKKTFKAKTKTKKYAITLKDNTGKAMKKVKVTLKVKGKTYKAKTNNKGKATFKIKNLKKKGKYTAVIKYTGDKNYNKITKKVKLTVKK